MSDELLKDFMHDSCAKISSKEANQAFKTGVKRSSRQLPLQVRKKKKGYTSCAKKDQKKQSDADEEWAKKRPKLTVALEVKKQASAVGRGLFVQKSFKPGFEAGDAIGEYVGERICEDEYQTRMEKYIAEKEFNYFVDVAAESGEVSGLYIDATRKGNWTRFVNNSHDPNSQFECVIIDGEYHIFLVALKKIRPGEEVTIDYGVEYRSPDQKFVECTCTAKNCSGVIGVRLEKAAIRKLLLEDIHYKDDDLNVLCAENRLLETQNQQYRKQITLARAALNQKVTDIMDQIFIPLHDHRPDQVRNCNNSIVQGLHQELAIAIGPPELTPYSNVNNQLVAPPRKGARISPRSASSGKRPASPPAAASAAAEHIVQKTDPAEVTPPQKKMRTRSVLSVHKLGDVTIESKTPDSSPPERVRGRPVTPAPVPQNVPTSNCSNFQISSQSDSDSDIVEVTPVAVRALPAPSRNDVRHPVTPPQKPELTVALLPKPGPSGTGNLIDRAIDWYKTACRLWNTRSDNNPDLPACPVHTKEPLKKMREFRHHFFTKHAGAANQYKRQLEAKGGSLSESEKKLFEQETQQIQSKI